MPRTVAAEDILCARKKKNLLSNVRHSAYHSNADLRLECLRAQNFNYTVLP